MVAIARHEAGHVAFQQSPVIGRVQLRAGRGIFDYENIVVVTKSDASERPVTAIDDYALCIANSVVNRPQRVTGR